MKKKPKIRKDKKGEFVFENYFIRGKMKKQKVYVVDGIPVEEFYRQNADHITLLQNEDYELLAVLKMEEQKGNNKL